MPRDLRTAHAVGGGFLMFGLVRRDRSRFPLFILLSTYPFEVRDCEREETNKQKRQLWCRDRARGCYTSSTNVPEMTRNGGI
jgi:hypothetical protein